MFRVEEGPLLLLDVDGVLNPLGRRAPGFRRYEVTVDGVVYTVYLNRRHGPRLLALAEETGAELAWATTWEHLANQWIAPRVGLPSLPVIELGGDVFASRGVMFKTPHVADYVKGRPFVWFDDAVGPLDVHYLREHPDVGDFLLIEIDRDHGITDAHLDQAREWLIQRGAGNPDPSQDPSRDPTPEP